MMRAGIFLFLSSLICLGLHGQPPSFQTTYSLPTNVAFNCRTNTICTQNTGFLSPIVRTYIGTHNLVLVKTFNDGTLDWVIRQPSDLLYTFPYVNSYAAEMSDGSFAVSAVLSPVAPATSPSLVVFRIASTGVVMWERSFVGDFKSVASVLVTASGMIVATGTITDSPDSDFWAGCLDASGNYQWSYTYDLGMQAEEASSACILTSGEIIIGGSSLSSVVDMHFAKISSNGMLLWGRVFNGFTDDYCIEVKALANGDFISVGRGTNPAPNTGCWDISAVRINSAGTVVWSRFYGGDECDEGYSVVENSDETLMFACEPESFIGWSQSALMKTESDGDFLWMKTYDGGSGTFPNSLTKTPDGGYVLSGTRGNFFSTSVPYFLNKTDANGDVECGTQNVLPNQSPYNIIGYNTGASAPSVAAITENHPWVVQSASMTNECDDTSPLPSDSVSIPNVFTPNEDGINDYFTVGVGEVATYHIWIYDRWGVLMFESTILNQPWNGNAPNGLPATDGTYYYVVETDVRNVSGFLTLVR